MVQKRGWAIKALPLNKNKGGEKMSKADKISLIGLVLLFSWLFISCFYKSWKFNFFRVVLLAIGIQA